MEPLFFEKDYLCFYVGRNGEFDQIVASTVRRLKKRLRNDNSSLIWAIPYVTAEYQENEEAYLSYYDEVELFNEFYGCHPKAALQARNRLIIDRADLVVVYVKTSSGGSIPIIEVCSKNREGDYQYS